MELKNFKLESVVKFNDDIQTIKINAKGYLKKENELILYFKKDNNKYKFFINNNRIKVYMNESIYEFSMLNKTKAIIKNNDLKMICDIITNKIVINSDSLQIDYVIDFKDFKGIYNIKLKYN